MDDTPHYSLGDAVELALDVSLDDWRRKHASSTPRSEVYAGPLMSTEVLVLRQSAGRLNITVSCIARRRHEDRAYFFRYVASQANAYRYISGSIEV